MTSRTLPADGWLDLGSGWLFASIRDAVVVVDAESARVVLWNPAASELFGYSADEALELSLGDLADDVLETPQWLACRDGSDSRRTFELFARTKTGADVCVELTLSRLDSPTANRAYVLSV